MKLLFITSILFSTMAMASADHKHDSAWAKTKRGINHAAEKIDSGTRSVIQKTKAKIKEEQQERKHKSARKDL